MPSSKDERTIRDIYEGMTDSQKTAVNFMVNKAAVVPENRDESAFPPDRSISRKAQRIAAKHYNSQLPEDSQHKLTEYDFYTVWLAKTLQNWKAMVSTDAHSGIYYEITHNGHKNETYVDLYSKVSNTVYQG